MDTKYRKYINVLAEHIVGISLWNISIMFNTNDNPR